MSAFLRLAARSGSPLTRTFNRTIPIGTFATQSCNRSSVSIIHQQYQWKHAQRNWRYLTNNANNNSNSSSKSPNPPIIDQSQNLSQPLPSSASQLPFSSPSPSSLQVSEKAQSTIVAINNEIASLPPPPPLTKTSSFLARPLNDAISNYPIELIASLAVLEVCSWQVTSEIINYAEWKFSLAFVVAYAISVPIRKSLVPKLVIGLPLGVGIATIFPFFKQIRISELLNNPIFQKLKRTTTTTPTATTITTSPTSSSPLSPSIASVGAAAVASPVINNDNSNSRRWWNPIRWAAFLTRAADRYGLALLIGYRLAGSLIIVGIYEAINLGVPMERIEYYLSLFGYSQDMRGMNKAAGYAASIVLSSVLFPITLLLAPFPARVLYRMRQAMRTKVVKKI